MEKLNTEVFLKVVETESFQTAAKELGYTQAGISYIINMTEKALGLKLFLRVHEGVRLTPEGEQLLPELRRINVDERMLASKVNELKNLETGSVSVRIFNSISAYWIPDIVSTFSKKYPGIDIRLISCENDVDAERMVYEQEVDCGFFVLPLHTPLETIFLQENPLVASVALDHPLAARNAFPVSEICNYPYIRMSYADDYYLSELFRQAGGVPESKYAIDNDYAALAMAARGLGYCIFPELIVRGTPFALKHLPLDPQTAIQIHVGAKSIAQSTKATKAFIDHVVMWTNEKSEKSF